MRDNEVDKLVLDALAERPMTVGALVERLVPPGPSNGEVTESVQRLLFIQRRLTLDWDRRVSVDPKAVPRDDWVDASLDYDGMRYEEKDRG